MTSIEWTDCTWNPVVGCTRVSPGCQHCYAEVMASRIANAAQARLRAGGKLTPAQAAYRGVVRWERGGKTPVDNDDKALPRWNGETRFLADRLDQPLRWRDPRKTFVNSMADLFHPGRSFEEIAAVSGVMAAAHWHTFQVLTKYIEQAVMFYKWLDRGLGGPAIHAQREAFQAGAAIPLHETTRTLKSQPWPLSNVWLGVSVEDQATADERIPLLLQCPAAVRFVSYEPALGPVIFSGGHGVRGGYYWLTERPCPACEVQDALGRPREEASHQINCGWEKDRGDGSGGIDWIIVGGESGPGARPFDLQWARDTIRQCRAADVPVFVKQLGAHPACAAWSESSDCGACTFGCAVDTILNRKGGDPSEWPEDLRIRMFPGDAY